MVRFLSWGVCALVVSWAGSARATDIRFGGQVRPRFEAYDPGLNGSNDTYTSMRVRTHLSAVMEDNVSVLVEVQDVRLWGGETGTLSDYRADNWDLHQGYFEIRGLLWRELSVRAGRQAVRMSNERLVGAVDWSQQGRSFDGIRVWHRRQAG